MLLVRQRWLGYQHKLLVVDIGSDEHCLLLSHFKLYNFFISSKLPRFTEMEFSLPYS
jgi:hypothetical protein